nr:hypothetical protein [Paracoccus mutanolyticus]
MLARLGAVVFVAVAITAAIIEMNRGISRSGPFAHLAAIAEQRDLLALQRADQEMGDPALILGSHLALAIDAGHAQDAGWAPAQGKPWSPQGF